MKVSGTNGSTYSGITGMSNPQIKAIDKQISELQKNIQKIKADKKLDMKSKSDKIKEYEDKITQLQQQKSQIQAEERKAKQVKSEQNSEAMRKPEENGDAPVKDVTQKALLHMDDAMKTGQKMSAVRTELNNKLRIAESKSYLREPDPEAAATYRGKISDIDNYVIGKAQKATDIIREADKADAVSGVNAADNDEKKAETEGKTAKQADTEEQKRKGTGRFEAGQFLHEEA